MMKLFAAKDVRIGLLLLFVIVALMFLPGAAIAQEELVAEEMYVLVWPEYLNTDVVVNQVGIFANNSEQIFQGRIDFQLPVGAEPIGLSVMLEDVYSRYYETIVEDDYKIVRYDMLEPLLPGGKLPLMVEYSYPLQAEKNGLRDLEIELGFRYPVAALEVGIQKPFRVTDFSLDPETDVKITDREGFEVYQYEYTDIEAGDALKFAFSYLKEDNLPSIDPEPAQPVHPVGEKEQEGLSSGVIIIIVIAFLLVMVLVLLLSRNMSQNKTKADKKDLSKGKSKTKR